ncbi:hypothetical protein B0J11DRAFT_496969 [Dendryphion nanum]|uniref:U1-type domain-containing protein n=1 Tax=Dendryphion nanum TaxID=256645 RepID=A0A9P9D868_9PLEO|nr:hypothetical protein B0J11DRAFT_496969 [Dendryphion nanum]
MSEYWKSTPKYWCKFCSLFVKDTKFDRKQHDSTGRHQGNIQRSLRGLHREKAAEDRQQQRAKDEIARLNGLVPGSASDASAGAGANAPGGDIRVGATPTFTKGSGQQATLEDRKRQAHELAAMGVAVPEQMRAELALVGDWQVVSQKIVGGEEKPLNTGIRKRKVDEEEQEALAAGEIITKKKGWGNTFKSFPGKMGGADDEVESLFKKVKKPAIKTEVEPEIKAEPIVKEESELKDEEQCATSSVLDIPTKEEADATAAAIKTEEEASVPAVVFKKRKKVAR